MSTVSVCCTHTPHCEAALSIHTSSACPCDHNNWDDVRQRKGVKVLRCRTCNAVWRWARGAKRGDTGLQRCIEFLNGRCTKNGSACPLLHVHRSKQSLQERVDVFGEDVLGRVPQAKGRRARSMDSSSDGLTDLTSETTSLATPKASYCRLTITMPVADAETEETLTPVSARSPASSVSSSPVAACAYEDETEEDDVLRFQNLFWQAGLL